MQTAGIEARQAEAIALVVKNAQGELVTKSDLRQALSEIKFDQKSNFETQNARLDGMGARLEKLEADVLKIALGMLQKGIKPCIMRISASKNISPAGRTRSEQGFMGIRSCRISATKDKSASRSGLAALAELMRKLRLDAHFECLCEDMPLMKLLGIRRLLAVAPHHRKKVTLDIGATAVHCEKRSSEFTYKKERGYMPIVGHVAETGMAVAAEFRGGSVSPNARNYESVRQCERALPRGVAPASTRLLHSMNGTPEASAAAVQWLRKSGQQELELDCPQAGDTLLSQGGYIVFARKPKCDIAAD